MIIRVFLICSIVVGCLWLLRGQRRAGRLAVTRAGSLLLAFGWAAAVLFPDGVTWVANLVGVGRGTDLVLYVTVVAFMFATVLQQRRNRELESRITALTRAHALVEYQVAEHQLSHQLTSSETPERLGHG